MKYSETCMYKNLENKSSFLRVWVGHLLLTGDRLLHRQGGVEVRLGESRRYTGRGGTLGGHVVFVDDALNGSLALPQLLLTLLFFHQPFLFLITEIVPF